MSLSFAQYLAYVQYLLVALIMLVLFGAVYVRLTPVRELMLIKQGNVACALSFGGALVGFCMTLVASIAGSLSLMDFVVWALVAAVLQIGVYLAATRLIADAAAELARNNVAVGTLCFTLSLSIGLLNAACLS